MLHGDVKINFALTINRNSSSEVHAIIKSSDFSTEFNFLKKSINYKTYMYMIYTVINHFTRPLKIEVLLCRFKRSRLDFEL